MSDSTPAPSVSRLVPDLVGSALFLIALVAWSFSASSPVPATRAWLFLAAAGAVLVALRRHLWPALVLVGLMALGMNDPRPETLDGWGVIFLVCTSLGTAMWVRRSGLRWVLASWPAWALSDTSEWLLYVALGLSIGGLAIAVVGPTLPGRPLPRRGSPMPHLASGPIAPVVPRSYSTSHVSLAIRVATVGFAILAAVLAILSARGSDPSLMRALALSSAIIATTFAFSNWFATRVRLRIDEKGLHSRTLFREHVVPWSETVALYLRDVFLPGTGVRIVYYCVRSTTREFAFPGSMPGATELKAAIERATGVAWPEPEVKINW